MSGASGGAAKPGWNPGRWLLLAAAVLLVAGSAGHSLWKDGAELISVQSYRNLADIVREMLPPNPGVVRDLGGPLLDTVAMSVTATVLAFVLAFPLAFLAARNTSPSPVVGHALKAVFNGLRTIPELIAAIIFVASVGFGTVSGILALGFHSAGMLGKFFAESTEKADPGLCDAVASCGGSRLHVIVYGVLPQILADAVDYTLYRWEHNFRASSVVGMVGAGGIGLELMSSLRLTQYRDVSAILIVVFVVVQAVELFGNLIRTRLVGVRGH